MSTIAFISKPSPENTRAVPGAVFNYLVRGQQTRNSFSLVKIEVMPGNEPPAHTHTREDEFYYILNGSMKFTVGNEVLTAHAGECIFLPMNVPHAFEVLSAKAEVLMWMSPAGLDQWFWDNSWPAPSMQAMPVQQGPPPPEAVEYFVKTLAEYGVMM
ncbi:MAG: cupin domain-containing protein [Chitinophagaceae bacterium]